MPAVDGLIQGMGASVPRHVAEIRGRGAGAVEHDARGTPACIGLLLLRGMGRGEHVVHHGDVELLVAVGAVGVEDEMFLQFGHALPLGTVTLGGIHHAVLPTEGDGKGERLQFLDILLEKSLLGGLRTGSVFRQGAGFARRFAGEKQGQQRREQQQVTFCHNSGVGIQFAVSRGKNKQKTLKVY